MKTNVKHAAKNAGWTDNSAAIAWLRELAQKSDSNVSSSLSQRIDYYRVLASTFDRRSREYKPDGDKLSDLEDKLNDFRNLIMARELHIRHRLIGANMNRVRQMAPCQRACLVFLDVHPDLLGPIGMRRYEPAHTQAIAYLSRQDPRLLSALLDLAQVPHSHSEDLNKARVSAESHIDDGRVDVLIDLPRALVMLEVKIDASEGRDQLARYRRSIDSRRNGRDGYLVYLTLEQESGRRAEQAICITFSDLLSAWLPMCANSTLVGGYLARYLKSVAINSGIAMGGQFLDWDFSIQRNALDLIEVILGGDE